jgi:hypothetical protein
MPPECRQDCERDTIRITMLHSCTTQTVTTSSWFAVTVRNAASHRIAARSWSLAKPSTRIAEPSPNCGERGLGEGI